MKLIILLFFPVALFGQVIPKGCDLIKVSGVSFKQVANALLDAGYSFEKIDSNFQTIKTDFKQSKSAKDLSLSLYVRVKDSSASITGKGYQRGVAGSYSVGKQRTMDDATFIIKNASGKYKKTFAEVNSFALSFNTLVEYLKQ
jgi:hypothetical protein